MKRNIEMSDKEMYRYYLIYDAFGDEAAARFLEREEARNMVNIERICKRNGAEDVLFYPYGIFGEQEEVIACIHKPKREKKNISEPEQEAKIKQEE